MQVETIIIRSLRRIGVLGAGQSPREIENTDALEGLKNLYQRWINEGAFGSLRDVTPTSNYIARENERIFRSSSSTLSITLPETVSNGYNHVCDYSDGYSNSVPANDMRLPRDGSVVVIIDPYTAQTQTFIYDGTVKSWCNVTNLKLNDNAPLSDRDTSGLASTLAIELADEYGQPVPEITMFKAAAFQMGLTHNYSQAGEVSTPTCYI